MEMLPLSSLLHSVILWRAPLEYEKCYHKFKCSCTGHDLSPLFQFPLSSFLLSALSRFDSTNNSLNSAFEDLISQLHSVRLELLLSVITMSSDKICLDFYVFHRLLRGKELLLFGLLSL